MNETNDDTFPPHTPRAPSRFSVCELIIHGLIKEEDVSADGQVPEELRVRAEDKLLACLNNTRELTTTQTSSIEMSEHLKCTICFTADRFHIFLPCFHFHTCKACGEKYHRRKISCGEKMWRCATYWTRLLIISSTETLPVFPQRDVSVSMSFTEALYTISLMSSD